MPVEDESIRGRKRGLADGLSLLQREKEEMDDIVDDEDDDARSWGSDSPPPPEGQIRVGSLFQAAIPDFLSEKQRAEFLLKPDQHLCTWKPVEGVPDSRVDEFLAIAAEQHGYTTEQSLGLLAWHNYSFQRALADLANFVPIPTDWKTEDKILFEQAFAFHGKNFQRIRQMLPDKSIQALVKYYYDWKPSRNFAGILDKQGRKIKEEDDSDDESMTTDDDTDSVTGDSQRKLAKKLPQNDADSSMGSCSNCSSVCTHLQTTPRGVLCNSCYQYYRRTGNMRTLLLMSKKRSSPHKKPDGPGAPGSGSAEEDSPHITSLIQRHPISQAHQDGTRAAAAPGKLSKRRRPPKSMYLSRQDLLSMAEVLMHHEGDLVDDEFRKLDVHIEKHRKHLQAEKQTCSQLESRLSGSLSTLGLPPDMCPGAAGGSGNKVTLRWTNEEALLCVMGTVLFSNPAIRTRRVHHRGHHADEDGGADQGIHDELVPRAYSQGGRRPPRIRPGVEAGGLSRPRWNFCRLGARCRCRRSE